MRRTFHFVAGIDNGIPVAICMEHDLVTQSETMDGLPDSCLDMLELTIEADGELGYNISDRQPPPQDAVDEVRALPGSTEFSVTVDIDDQVSR